MEQNKTRAAYAQLRGDDQYPDIRGYVSFNQLSNGVLVTAKISGLPYGTDGMGIYAFHIHEGEDCGGMDFADSMLHFNPENHPHPYHAGDLPPLFSNNGSAYMSVLTDRFTVNEIVGRTVIIHAGVDDFTTQPSGNSGAKIACGKIMRI